MAKVSIVVPIYNAEDYLKRCIDSLVNQTLKDIEIILINDGSTDNSNKIVEDYLSDKRIVYINKKNEGIGKTRNLGISKCTGEYLVFVDSDDFVDKNYCKKMYNYAKKNKCDFVVSDYTNYIEETAEKRLVNLPFFSNTSLKKNSEIMNMINLGPCNKIYSTKLIKDNNLSFAENLKYEDVPFVCSVLNFAKKIGKINESFCYFSIHEGSQTTVRDQKIFDILKIMDIVKDLFAEKYSESEKKLRVNTVLNYVIQARYIKEKKVRHSFVDACFKYLKSIDKKWFKYITDKEFKHYIFKSRYLVKKYCDNYQKSI
ncbi:MAG: glycosyltransferase family 2 protein [Bacilli bacterium]|nr:glycosyltransferase family 2 protein [Bacilli bacterium]